MRFRACWILLGGSFFLAVAGLKWQLAGDCYRGQVFAASAAANLVYFLWRADGADPTEVFRVF